MWWAKLYESRRLLFFGDEQMSAGQQHSSFAPRALGVGPRARDFAAPFHRKIDRGNYFQRLGVDKFGPWRCFLKQQNAPEAVSADGLNLGVALGKHRT